MSYAYADRFTVVAEKEMAVAAGDRLQLKFNGKSTEGIRLNNGDLVTVREVAPDGSVVVEAGGEAGSEKKTLAPSQLLFTVHRARPWIWLFSRMRQTGRQRMRSNGM